MKGEARVILVLFMNGWLCVCEEVYIQYVCLCVCVCLSESVCVFVNGAPYCISAGAGHLPFPLLC